MNGPIRSMADPMSPYNMSLQSFREEQKRMSKRESDRINERYYRSNSFSSSSSSSSNEIAEQNETTTQNETMARIDTPALKMIPNEMSASTQPSATIQMGTSSAIIAEKGLTIFAGNPLEALLDYAVGPSSGMIWYAPGLSTSHSSDQRTHSQRSTGSSRWASAQV